MWNNEKKNECIFRGSVQCKHNRQSLDVAAAAAALAAAAVLAAAAFEPVAVMSAKKYAVEKGVWLGER